MEVARPRAIFSAAEKTADNPDAQAWLKADVNQQRGEFVLLVEAAIKTENEAVSEEAINVLKLLLNELPLKQAVKLAAEISGEKKNALYELALKLKE